MEVMVNNLMYGLAIALALAGGTNADTPAGPASREFELTLEVTLPGIIDSKEHLRVWLPVPQERSAQEVTLVDVESPYRYRFTTEKEYGNKVFFAEGKSARKPQTIRLTWRVKRHTQRGLDSAADDSRSAPDGRDRAKGLEPASLHLEPRGLVLVNDEIRAIAEDVTRESGESLAKARALYDYVLKHMKYEKNGEGWGHGDSVYACEVGKGNCTDFHSLFMSLSMVTGIPSRFNMGYPLPDEAEGTLKGYHCWAEFYHSQHGWVPVDISEAWKHADRREFYFGTLDPNRVLLSTGRDVLLSPAPNSGRLNWFLEPYAEVKGQPVGLLTATWRYRDFDSNEGG